MLALAAAIIAVWGLWAHFTAVASKGLGRAPAVFWLGVCTAACHALIALAARWAWADQVRGTSPGLFPVLAGITAAGGYALFVIGQGRFQGSVFVPLTALYPAISVLLAIWAFRETPTGLQWAGVVLACLAGVLLGCGR